MDQTFRLTSDEYSRILGISTEALRSRRRRGQEDGNFKKIGKVFWWKSPGKDRPTIVDQRSNDRRSLSPVARKRRRGVLEKGLPTNYHNANNGWQLEELNRVRALGKIRDQLGDEVVDEITPELFELAKKNVAKKKEENFKKELSKAEAPPNGIITGTDQTPLRYGTRLNAIGLKNKAEDVHARSLRKWLNETKVKFDVDPGKKHLPDFTNNSGSFRAFRNPYGPPPEDDGSVEFEVHELRLGHEPKFKNKVEEEIHRLKKKFY